MLAQGKTKRDDIEIKKLEMLNSILIKELRGYKLKINELQDENENLQAENLKLKNSFVQTVHEKERKFIYLSQSNKLHTACSQNDYM